MKRSIGWKSELLWDIWLEILVLFFLFFLPTFWTLLFLTIQVSVVVGDWWLSDW